MDIPSSLCGLRPTSGRPEAAQAGPASVHINAYIDIYIDGYWDCNRFARCRHEGFHGGEPDAAGPRIVAKGRRSHRWSNAARPVPRGTGWQISRWFLLRRERVRQGSCADRKHEGNGQGHRRNRAAHAKKKRDYSGAAGGARTPDLRLRRPVLYPAELLPRDPGSGPGAAFYLVADGLGGRRPAAGLASTSSPMSACVETHNTTASFLLRLITRWPMRLSM